MKFFRPAVLLASLLSLTSPARATIEAALQSQLGNPSGATADASNHGHYLLSRAQFAADYSDAKGQPLWVGWDLTSGDVGPAPRSASFFTDTSLPAGFYAVTDADYVGVGAINYNRGHMSPSEDRTATVADNLAVFFMTNIVPQAGDNNQGPWEVFETYSRTLAAAGNEILLISGPSGFGTPATTIPSGKAVIAGYVWKIAVVVPLGTGSALSRITTGTRVIALKMPNVNGIRSVPWQSYVTTVAQIEADTGFTFFSALPAATAAALRVKTDSASTAGLPAITVQPAPQSAIPGGSATFSVTAVGNAPLAYQWSKDGSQLAGATAATLALTNLAAADYGSYSVLVSNAVGSAVSNAVTLTSPVSTGGGSASVAWDFTTATPSGGLPSDNSVTVGALTAGNNNGTTALITNTSVSGTYAGASAGNNAGAAARVGSLDRGATGSAYFEFSFTPSAGNVLVVTALSFGARSTGTGPQAFSVYSSADNFSLPIASGALVNNSAWTKLAPALLPVAGARGAALTLRLYGYGGAGNAAASTTNWRMDDLAVTAAAVAAVPPSDARLVNIASRSRAGVAADAAFAGLTISGTGAKSLLIRAVGPTLTSFGVTGVLAQPKLELFRGATSLGTNTGWTTGGDSAALAAAATVTGAFALSVGSADAAMLVSLTPGGYSAVASAADGRSGVGLVEIYEVPSSTTSARLTNISTRANVESGTGVLIAGFVITGNTPQRVLLRAAGPGLAQFGLGGTLAKPQLTLLVGNNAVAQNTGWSTAPDPAALAQAAVSLGAFAFATGSADAALIATLAPGAYTATVAGADGAGGQALVEVYELP